MCWCTPNVRTPICKNCPPEKQEEWKHFDPVNNFGVKTIPKKSDKIIAYQIACGRTIGIFERMVNDKLKEGFQPFNSIFTITSGFDNHIYFLQAMVMYE